MSKSRNNTILLAIDEQNDFHDVAGASLPVPNSVEDLGRLSRFIERVNPGNIFASMDTHYVLSIFHPSWWQDSKGNPPGPFTMIRAQDVQNGKYTPRVDPVRTLSYLVNLEANGEFTHTIWPVHCEKGTVGHAFHPIFADATNEWMVKNGRWVYYIDKGLNPHTEHFGIFRANVPIAEDPSTQVKQEIFKALNDADVVYLAGQARTHCVANSLRQLLEISPTLAKKLTVLTDCTSNVVGMPDDFYPFIDSIYKDAESKGVQMVKSTDVGQLVH